jgi:hypothetical protein
VQRDISEFIGVDGSALPTAAVQIHENKTMYPKFYRLLLLKNRYLPMAGNVCYQQHFNSSGAHHHRGIFYVYYMACTLKLTRQLQRSLYQWLSRLNFQKS